MSLASLPGARGAEKPHLRHPAPDPNRELERLGWLATIAIFAVGLGCRLAYLGMASKAPDFWTPYLDARWHVQWATAVAQGHLLGAEAFFRAPLYPYFLGALFALFGPDLLVARVVQGLLGAATAVLVGTLGARLFGRQAGVLAGFLFACAASPVLFDSELLLEAVYVPLVVVSLVALEAAHRAPSLGGAARVGFALGVAAIARPNIVLTIPLAAFLVLIAARRAGWSIRRQAGGLCLLGAGFGLPITPVTLHNWLASRDFVAISWQGGVNFFIGNSAEASGDEAFMPAPTDTETYATDGTYTDNVLSASRSAARHALGREPKPSEISGYWFRQALEWIRDNPLSWARLTARKALYCVGAFEIGDQRNLAQCFASWHPFALLPRWGWLFPLAVAGLLLPGESRGRLLLLGWSAVYTASIIAFFVTERFRLPLYPALCILAARGVAVGARLLAQRLWRPVLLPALAALATALLIHQDPTGYTLAERMDALRAQASAAASRGALARAEQLYLEALALAPPPGAKRPVRWGGRRHLPEVLADVRAEYSSLLRLQGRDGEARAVAGPR